MTGANLITRIRYLTKTTSVSLTDADALPLVNSVKDEIAGLISQRNEQLFVIPSTFDLVASSVTAREYALPDDILSNLMTVELALDTASPTVFVACLPYPGGMQRLLRNLNGITEAKITTEFTNSNPFYIKMRRSIYILSGTVSALADGGKIRYRLYPADLANLTGVADLNVDPTTTSFGMPKNFHELWARRVGIIWKQGRPKPIPLSDFEKLYDRDMESALDSISDDDYAEEIIGSLPEGDSPSQLGANV